MTNREVRLLANEIDRISIEICDNYETCEQCPLNVIWSRITQNNGTEFGSNCTSIIMQRVFAENMAKGGCYK